MIYRKAICFVFSFLLSSQLCLRFRASFVETLKVEMEKAGRKLSQTHFAAICLLAETNGAVHGEGSKSFARHIAYSLKSLDLWFMTGFYVSHRKAIKLAVAFYVFAPITAHFDAAPWQHRTSQAISRVNQIYLTDVPAWHPCEKEFVININVFINWNAENTSSSSTRTASLPLNL